MQTHTNATLATLTYGGYKSATVAATAYGQLVSIMDGKTDLMTKRIDKMLGTTTGYVKVLKDVHGQMTMVTVKVTEHNKAFNEAYFKTLDYSHQLQYLNNVMKGHYDQLQNVLGGSKQAASAFTTLMTHSKMFADDLKELSNQQKNAAATQEKWAITQSGFSQTMARAGAAVQVLMITVGQALLPILAKLGQQLLPLITSFTTWLQKSGALQLVGSLLAGAFQLVFNVIGNILSVAGAIIGFFQQNEVAGALLIGTLTAIAAIIAVSVIPGLIVAGLTAVATFIAWAVAAGAAAIATIAATWPIILIGVIVAAVVAGIILAIQHWGQIMDFFANKAQITADKVALAHTKMRISADDNQKKQAEKSLSNLEKERQGILTKLKQAHSEQERAALQHQLRMVDAQIDGQNKRIAQAEADKQLQIQKQKELQDKLQEDQKNWFVRLLDDILGFFGMVFGAIGGFFGNIFSKIGQFKDAVIQKFRDIWNGIVDGAKSILNGLGTTIVNLVKIPVNLVIGGINHLIDGYNNLPKLGAPNLGHIPLLASGAENFQGGMAYVHAGEVLTYLPRGASVTPAHRVSAALRAGGGAGGSGAYIHNGDIIINAPNANADEVARKVEAILDRKLRRSGSITTTTSGGRAAS